MSTSASASYMYTRVWEIHQLLYPKPEDLTSPDRFAVREEELYMWDEKRKKKRNVSSSYLMIFYFYAKKKRTNDFG